VGETDFLILVHGTSGRRMQYGVVAAKEYKMGWSFEEGRETRQDTLLGEGQGLR